ncbi:hypothetical protein TpMuguga_01g01215 [Theileria parva strain Muguga]|uniref:Uncharacterized protein n=1 Tax=Theileria parva TaxID=5875 RepID=Q4N6F5_THEPA|nr:uncharacterized protein TpMuguga_01g01215 [Theileria parva strain Muguga]EAN34453.1 hypothetical protein TpMuguga_01g01215 [Theileria parva strain Muguga]|eukprot:XP_766736.1 hypothetical protein [Theileria parva strain Muguga]
MSDSNSNKSNVIEYNSYVHFAYHIGKYLVQKCESESCDEKTLLSWYLENPGKYVLDYSYSLDKLRAIYENLMDNLIDDECVTVISGEPGSRIVKKNPEFFVWAWRSLAKVHERKSIK